MSEHLTHDAIKYFKTGMEELDQNVLVGEPLAKAAILIGMATRQNVVLSGVPGGGKSTLANSVHRLVSDVDPANVVMIPGQHDLTANQLVGGEVVIEKEIDDTSEKHKSTITGMVQPTTQILRLGEPDRAPAHALQSILPVMEEREIQTSAGRVALPNLISVIASMNPSESRESTFKISNAMASRFGVGAIMGETGDVDYRKDMNRKVRAFKGNPAEVKPITSSAQLAQLRPYLADTAIGFAESDRIDELAIHTADALKEHNITETDRRITKQLEANAKALGGLRNENQTVAEVDLQDSVRLVVAARLGALNNLNGDSVRSIAADIIQR